MFYSLAYLSEQMNIILWRQRVSLLTFIYLTKIVAMNTVYRIQHWVEKISTPAFAILITYMATHGVMEIIHGTCTHNDHQQMQSGTIALAIVFGVVFCGITGLVWNTTPLKRFVPCRHENCSKHTFIGHSVGILIFVLHFFPEAYLRHEMLTDNLQSIVQGVVYTAFNMHLITDVIVSGILISQWQQKNQRIITACFILLAWCASRYVGLLGWNIPIDHGIADMLMAFCLGMFVELPEKVHYRKILKLTH